MNIYHRHYTNALKRAHRAARRHKTGRISNNDLHDALTEVCATGLDWMECPDNPQPKRTATIVNRYREQRASLAQYPVSH